MDAFVSEPVYRRLYRRRGSSLTSSATAAQENNEQLGTTTTTTSTTTYPSALPCHRFYSLFPNEVGPLGNLVVTDPEELKPWLLVAHPVTASYAAKHGGCIMYTPLNATEGTPASVKPLYYSLRATADEVYGRAAYLPCTNTPNKCQGEKDASLTCSFDSDTSDDGCTEDMEDGRVSRSSSRLLSRRISSLFL